MSRDLSDLRESYQRAGLRRSVLAPDPVEILLFERWENHQNSAGDIRIPAALQPFLGGRQWLTGPG